MRARVKISAFSCPLQQLQLPPPLLVRCWRPYGGRTSCNWTLLTLAQITLDISVSLDGRLLLPELCYRVACFQGDHAKYASGFNLFWVFFISANDGEIKPNTKSFGICDSGFRVISPNYFIYAHK